MIVGALLLAFMTSASQRTWDGGGVDWDWRTPANWDGSIVRPSAPDPGDTLVFPVGPAKRQTTNDFGAGTNFTALIFSGQDYSVGGNSIGLSNGISSTAASSGTFLFLPLILRENQTFSVTSPDSYLYLYDISIDHNILTFDGDGNFVLLGDISNSLFFRGSLRKSGTGRLTVLQPTGHDAPTIVNGGILAVESRMTNSVVTVNNGGTLRGTGRIGGLNANSGGIVQPGNNNPGVLESFGDVALDAGSTFRVRLNGTSAGVDHDQLEVNGTVTLGGTLEVVLGYTPAVGDRFTIIANDENDDVTGTFAGLPQNAEFMLNGRPFRIIYGDRFGGFGRDSNDVIIEAIPALAVWDGGGGQNNRWSEPSNWVGDIVPFPGDDVQFTNTTSITTSNDFAPGRLFGSILFGPAGQVLKGNPAELAGILDIRPFTFINIQMPITLQRSITFLSQTCGVSIASISLRNDITLRPNLVNLTITNVTLAGNELTVEVPDGRVVPVYRTVAGPGILNKTGLGEIRLSGTNDAQNVASAGRLSIGPTAYLTAGLEVRNGGHVFCEGYLTTLDVLGGGSFEPSYQVEIDTYLVRPTAFGDVRFHPGSYFDAVAYTVNTGGNPIVVPSCLNVGAIGYGVANTLSLSNATLRINPGFTAGTIFTKGSWDQNPTLGTFNNLPEGQVFAANDSVFRITYLEGMDFDDIRIFATPELDFVWTGAARDGYWSTPGNWSEGVAPLSGVRLLFPATAHSYATTNDIEGTFSTQRLRIDSGSYVIAGNRINAGSISCSNVAGEAVILSEITTPGSLGSGDVLAISVTNNLAALRLEGRIFGGNTWRKTGPGRLRISGTGTNSPDLFRVSDGLVELMKTGGNAVGRWLEVGEFSPSTPATVRMFADDQIPDLSTLDIGPLGTFDLNGHSESVRTLGVISSRGTIILGTAIQPGSLTVSTGRFAGSITGVGTLNKIGPLSLVLTGTNTFSGPTVVTGGTLQVDGVHASSTTRVEGGRLQGRGLVGVLQVTSGTVSPGWGGAEFQNYLHSGNVNLSAGASFEPMLTGVDPGFEAHRLQVAGSVSLGGCLLNVILLGNFVPPTNKTFMIIENDGTDAVTGTFAGLVETAVFGVGSHLFRISYAGGSGNDVTLTRLPPPRSDLTSIQSLGQGRVLIQGSGIQGLHYDIQAASNLHPVINWIQIGQGVGDGSGMFQFIHSNSPANPIRFYRAVTP